MSESEAYYQDMHKYHFSEKLADWAISMMEKVDPATGKMKPIAKAPVEDVLELLRLNNVKIKEECIYDAWYLYHMVMADYYGSSIEDKAHVAKYIKDTICDPDGCPEMVLACFRAKCDVKNIPIHWERYL